MFIELKAPRLTRVVRNVSEDQKRIIERLNELGYVAFYSNNFEQITTRIMHYLELRP